MLVAKWPTAFLYAHTTLRNCLTLAQSNTIQNMHGCYRLRRDARTQRSERVVDGGPDRGCGAHGTRLADAACAKLRGAARSFDMRDVDVRHLAGHRNQVVDET